MSYLVMADLNIILSVNFSLSALEKKGTKWVQSIDYIPLLRHATPPNKRPIKRKRQRGR